MESMTDWAFSWPISVGNLGVSVVGGDTGEGLGDWVRDARTLVVVYDIAQVVATAVVCFAHAHGVVGEVDIAVVAEDCGKTCALVYLLLIKCLTSGLCSHFGILNALFWILLMWLLCWLSPKSW